MKLIKAVEMAKSTIVSTISFWKDAATRSGKSMIRGNDFAPEVVRFVTGF